MTTTDTQNLDFARLASGAYGALAPQTTRYYSVTRLTSSKWVMEVSSLGGRGPHIREEAPTMRQAMVRAEVRELAAQGRTGEALDLLNTIR